MSYSVFRIEGIKTTGALRGIGKHDKDRISKTNPDIDKEKSKDNIEIIKCQGSYNDKFKKITHEMKVQHDERMKNMRADRVKSFEKSLNTSKSDVACEMIFTSDEEFFTGLNKSDIEEWAKTSLDFVTKDIGISKDNIIHAIVHMDEKTPHLHVVAVPLVDTYDARRKENILKISRAKYIPDKIAISKLQDRYNERLNQRGYKLSRGDVGAKKEHKTTAEFKQEQLRTLERKLSITKRALNRDDEELSKVILSNAQIDSIKGKESLIGNNVTIKMDELTKLKEMAKKGNYNASKVKELERKYDVLNKSHESQKNTISSYSEENLKLRESLKVHKKNIDILRTQKSALISVVKDNNLLDQARMALEEEKKINKKTKTKDWNRER